MLTIIILASIGIIIGIYETYHDRWSDGLIFYIVNSIVGIVLGVMLGLIIAFCLPMETTYRQETYNIVSLQDNSSVSGSFFIGCGNIEGEMCYVFYTEEDGAFQLNQVSYHKAKIKYTDEKPTITKYTIIATDNKINWFALDSDIGNKSFLIEVPSGTIKTNYTLDAQ